MKKSILLLALCLSLSLSGCVDQSGATVETTATAPEETLSTEVVTDVENRLIATSFATSQICAMLDLELVGVTQTGFALAERYSDLPTVGGAMAPDYEIIASLAPTNVIGPDTLQEEFEAKYQALNIPYTFLNLRSVQGLYESVEILGDLYDREELASQYIAEYEETLAELEEARGDQDSPTVLMMMGFPGSYVQCTPTAYVGNLVELAGGVNIVTDPTEDFVLWNTEELLLLDPDYILVTAHAMENQVVEMFQEEFATNDIWQHFSAVQGDRVYYLDSSLFHMSANFDWDIALTTLYEIFYDVSVS